MRAFLPFLCILFAVSAPLSSASAQRKKKQKPCTVCQNNPKLYEKLGINHGPFVFGQSNSTQLEEELVWKGYWLETPHFRIALDLDKWKIPITERKAYRKELGELKKKYPKVKDKTASLDPWYRIHLFGERAEALYETFLQQTGRQQEEFDTLPPEEIFKKAFENDFEIVLQDYDRKHERAAIFPGWLGLGRYLGQPMKFELMLSQTEGLFLEYKKMYTGITQPRPQKWNNKIETVTKEGLAQLRTRSLWFGISADAEEIKHDQHMHNAILHNLAINLMDGYMLYLYDMPIWLSEGYAHYTRRKNTPDWSFYDAGEGSSGPDKDARDWAPLVRKYVKREKVPPLTNLIRLNDYVDLDFEAHLSSWSLVDFLFAQGDGKFGLFLTQLSVQPNGAGSADAQRDAFKEVFGWTIRQVEENWKAWILETYSTQ